MPKALRRKTAINRSEGTMSKYDDIINRKYCGSISTKKLSMEARAAQFAPFSALTGHNSAIAETARLTSERVELSYDEQLYLSQRLNLALSLIGDNPELTITYFVPDHRKQGGEYVKAHGYIAGYTEYDNMVTLSDGSKINIRDIRAIDGAIFNDDLFY